MALQVSVLAADTLVGTDCPESYVKVEFVRAWNAASLIWVNWYADAQARADMKQPVKQKEYTAPTTNLVGANIIAASYEWLKVLPEFEGAIDVLSEPTPVVPVVEPVIVVSGPTPEEIVVEPEVVLPEPTPEEIVTPSPDELLN